jgi:Iap family predicted aminopeptidase
MKRFFLAIGLFVFLGQQGQAQNDSIMLRKMADEIMLRSTAYENLRYLCKKVGPRLSGSPQAQKAVEETARMLREAGADTVYLQPCMVPRWVRGEKEQGIIAYNGKQKALHVCALGMSIGTPSRGIKADVIEVMSFEELDKLSEDLVKGKIVFFNYAMRPELINGGYGDAVRYRSNGPVAAAKKGAVAVMIRSVTHSLDYFPHTGATRYDSTVTRIPAFACSTMDAEWLSQQMKTKSPVQLFLKSSCRQLADVPSYNVIGEIRGSEKPEEIITAGGHLDSWDLAEGAHDDGSGCMQSIEVIRAIKAMGLKPKRTIRAVLFMNEENGLRGGNAYAEYARQHNENHLFAVESDAGGFGVQTLGISGKPQQFEKAKNWEPLLRPYGIYEISKGGGGADIGPLRLLGTVMCGVNPGSQRYFDHHHAANDVFEAVNKRELELGAFGMASICWLVSEYGL